MYTGFYQFNTDFMKLLQGGTKQQALVRKKTKGFTALEGKVVAKAGRGKGQATNATLQIRLRKYHAAGQEKSGWPALLAPLAAAGGTGTAVPRVRPGKEKEKARAR